MDTKRERHPSWVPFMLNQTTMPIDWTKIYKKYKGLWVALKDDYTTVVASGKTPEETLKSAKKNGFTNPFLTHVPEEVTPFVG